MNTATVTPLYGYTEQGALPHVVHPSRLITVCGRKVSYIPEVQPADPAMVCRRCTHLVDNGSAFANTDSPASEPDGVCGWCTETHLLTADGVLVEHLVKRTKSGWVPCDGSGTAPEVAE